MPLRLNEDVEINSDNGLLVQMLSPYSLTAFYALLSVRVTALKEV